MYKSVFHNGVCSKCGSENVNVITVGLDNNSEFNKNYCNNCSDKFKFRLHHYADYVARYFKFNIEIDDLKYFIDIDDLLRCLCSYAISEEFFVNLVNKIVDKKYTYRSQYAGQLMKRLSVIHNINYFESMDPYKYRIYQNARSSIINDTHISCKNEISKQEFDILIHSMNTLFPILKN